MTYKMHAVMCVDMMNMVMMYASLSRAMENFRAVLIILTILFF
jgi:hypothetical protein